MGRDFDRRRIASQICTAAEQYSRSLVGRQFLYVFDGRYIEVLFKAENFKHLTGVETPLSARSFFSYAKRGILAASQISFGPQHPYSLCLRKVDHITNISRLAESESFLLEEISTQTVTYKFGMTDLDFSLCLGEDKKNTDPERKIYIPQSLRDEDCFSKSRSVFAVTHIFCKKNDSKVYTDLIYQEPNCVLPKETLLLLSEELSQFFS